MLMTNSQDSSGMKIKNWIKAQIGKFHFPALLDNGSDVSFMSLGKLKMLRKKLKQNLKIEKLDEPRTFGGIIKDKRTASRGTVDINTNIGNDTWVVVKYHILDVYDYLTIIGEPVIQSLACKYDLLLTNKYHVCGQQKNAKTHSEFNKKCENSGCLNKYSCVINPFSSEPDLINFLTKKEAMSLSANSYSSSQQNINFSDILFQTLIQEDNIYEVSDEDCVQIRIPEINFPETKHTLKIGPKEKYLLHLNKTDIGKMWRSDVAFFLSDSLEKLLNVSVPGQVFSMPSENNPDICIELYNNNDYPIKLNRSQIIGEIYKMPSEPGKKALQEDIKSLSEYYEQIHHLLDLKADVSFGEGKGPVTIEFPYADSVGELFGIDEDSNQIFVNEDEKDFYQNLNHISFSHYDEKTKTETPITIKTGIQDPKLLKKITDACQANSRVFYATDDSYLPAVKGFECNLGVRPNIRLTHHKPPKGITPEMSRALKFTLENMHKKGVLKKSNSNFSNKIIIVKKKPEPGSDKVRWRLCVGMTELGRKSDVTQFNIKSPIEQLETIAGTACIFSILDLHNAFFQMALRLADQEATGILDEGNNSFVYQRAPQGHPGSAGNLAKMLDQKFPKNTENYPGEDYFRLRKYYDDLLSFSDSEEAEVNKLCELLYYCNSINLTFSPKKTILAAKKVVWSGHELDGSSGRTQIRVPQDYKIKLSNMKEPENTTQAQAYASFMNYFSHFVPNMSKYLSPITQTYHSEHRNPDGKYVFPTEARTAFQELNAIMNQNLYTVVADLTADAPPLCLYTDASKTWISAIAVQDDPKTGKPNLIAAVSRKLSKYEQHNSIFSNELKAMGLCDLKFKSYLLAPVRKHWYIDSRSIYLLCSTKTKTSSRAFEFLDSLINIYRNVTIKWCNSESNISDYFSRQHADKLKTNFIEHFIPQHLTKDHAEACFSVFEKCHPGIGKILAVTTRSKAKETHSNDSQNTPKILPGPVIPEISSEDLAKLDQNANKNYSFPREKLKTSGIEKIVQPHLTPFEKAVKIHEKYHFSSKKMIDILGITGEEAAAILKSCVSCVNSPQQKKHVQETSIPLDLPLAPLRKVNIDTFSVSGSVWEGLAVTCMYSKFMFIKPLKSLDTSEVICKMDEMFQSTGYPFEVRSDNYKGLRSVEFQEKLAERNCFIESTIPYRSNGNSIVERHNRSLKQILYKIGHNVWHTSENIKILMFELNFIRKYTYQHGVDEAPANVFYGFKREILPMIGCKIIAKGQEPELNDFDYEKLNQAISAQNQKNAEKIEKLSIKIQSKFSIGQPIMFKTDPKKCPNSYRPGYILGIDNTEFRVFDTTTNLELVRHMDDIRIV